MKRARWVLRSRAVVWFFRGLCVVGATRVHKGLYFVRFDCSVVVAYPESAFVIFLKVFARRSTVVRSVVVDRNRISENGVSD